MQLTFTNMVRSIFSTFMRQHLMYKCLITMIFIITIITLSYWNDSSEHYAKKCFLNDFYNKLPRTTDDESSAESIQFLEDIMISKKKPKLGKSIFFHETSCSNGIVHLNPRQACAIESAALTNPDWDVFLLYASPVGFLHNTSKEAIINSLETYPNIHMRNVNLWTYAQNTSINSWFNDGTLFRSKYLNSHASDFLRYLSLFKWGGTYLDLDVILKRSLNDIQPNYAGAESENFVAAGILNFDYKGIGHEIAESCLREFQLSFDGDDWGNNGPGVITRVLYKVCQTKFPELMTRKRCRGFKVYPINAFYAIKWPDWRHFFEPQHTKETIRKTNGSIAVHFWNKHSYRQLIDVGSNVAYGLLADKYCPKVYHACGIHKIRNRTKQYTILEKIQ